MNTKIDPRPVILASMILIAGICHLGIAAFSLSPMSNITPIGAMALFGGFHFQDKWKAYLVPLLTLWFTDIVLNRFFFFGEWVLFYDDFIWVYGSFALMTLVGSLIKKVSVVNVLVAAVASALIHWIVSDFGVWIGGSTDITTGLPFTRDWQGYWRCLFLALPYLKNMMIGNLVFGTVLFGCFEIMQYRFPILRLQVSAKK